MKQFSDRIGRTSRLKSGAPAGTPGAAAVGSAYALRREDVLSPLIRNLGSMLVKGASPVEVIRQYMAKGDSPTRGRELNIHFGDVEDRNFIGQISHRGVLAYQEPESLALFTQGKAIFHRNWSYAWEIANDSERSRVAEKVGMVPLPAFPGGKSVAALGGWQLAISRFSRKPEAAWKFVAFMSSREIQRRIALLTGRAPAREDIYRDPDLLKKYRQFETLLKISTHAVPRPRSPVYAPLSNIMQRYFSSVLALPNTEIKKHAALAARDQGAGTIKPADVAAPWSSERRTSSSSP